MGYIITMTLILHFILHKNVIIFASQNMENRHSRHVAKLDVERCKDCKIATHTQDNGSDERKLVNDL